MSTNEYHTGDTTQTSAEETGVEKPDAVHNPAAPAGRRSQLVQTAGTQIVPISSIGNNSIVGGVLLQVDRRPE